MRLRNHTDLPAEWIREVIRAVCPSGVSGFDVRVSNMKKGFGARGRAYHQGSSYHDRACPFIVVSVATTEERARMEVSPPHGTGYLPHTYGSRREAVLFVLAHELRHLWQAKVKRGRRVWGARGQFSERDADAYAISCLRRYRRGELKLASNASAAQRPIDSSVAETPEEEH